MGAQFGRDTYAVNTVGCCLLLVISETLDTTVVKKTYLQVFKPDSMHEAK